MDSPPADRTTLEHILNLVDEIHDLKQDDQFILKMATQHVEIKSELKKKQEQLECIKSKFNFTDSIIQEFLTLRNSSKINSVNNDDDDECSKSSYLPPQLSLTTTTTARSRRQTFLPSNNAIANKVSENYSSFNEEQNKPKVR